jgi:hypothetical protein
MNRVTVLARLVDGGIQDFEFGPEFLDHLRALRAEGLTGKRLIHALITDDWGPPPRMVEISGTTTKGEYVNVTIHYS